MMTSSMKFSRFAPITIVAFALELFACAKTVRGVGKNVKGAANGTQGTVQ